MAEPTAVFYSFALPREGTIGVDAPEANGPAFVERKYMNIDLIEGVKGAEALATRDYKTIHSVYPLGRVPEGSPPVAFLWGATDHAGYDDIPYNPPQPYDSMTDGQLDYQSSGRYHSIRIEYDGFDLIKIAGFNIEMTAEGSRG